MQSWCPSIHHQTLVGVTHARTRNILRTSVENWKKVLTEIISRYKDLKRSFILKILTSPSKI